LKKFVLLASVVAIVVAALALPAMASERWDNNDWWKDHDDNKNSWWDHNDWWKDHDDKNDDDDRNDDFDRFFFDRDFDRFFGGGEVDQSFEQESESGDVDQSFNVSNTGDNSNQCAGVQGVANTGNAQNQISVLQNGSEADDFSFEDSGSSIEVSPNNLTSCDQEVNQAASAAYHGW
jgi:Ni/Co efflux regulator RcnB